MKASLPTERQVQRAILQMCGVAFPDVLIHASPNGAHLAGDNRSRFMQMGALKGDGLKPGWPDLTCVWDHGTAYMEVKRPGRRNRVSAEQELIHLMLRERRYPVLVVTSPEEAFNFLRGVGAPTNVREWREAA
jgi:VRR-NUC domain